MGLTTTSHHLGWRETRGSKYPTNRPMPPFLAVCTAIRAASRSSASQKSIHELCMKGPMSHISSACIPPSFMNKRRPSRSRTLMQSRLQATRRLLNSSAARRDSAASPCWLARRASSSLARRSSHSSACRRSLSLLDMGAVTPALPLAPIAHLADAARTHSATIPQGTPGQDRVQGREALPLPESYHTTLFSTDCSVLMDEIRLPA